MNRDKLLKTSLPALAAVALDLGSKRLAMGFLTPYEIESVTGFFNLSLVFNPGAAFSLLSGDGPWQGVKMTALALIGCVTRNHTCSYFAWRIRVIDIAGYGVICLHESAYLYPD
jgi:lipoprotein signal peptidase